MRFLLRWQHVAPATQLKGRRGVREVVEQLQGFERPPAPGSEEVLPARVPATTGAWLDELCLSGEVAWAPPRAGRRGRGAASVPRGAAVASLLRDADRLRSARPALVSPRTRGARAAPAGEGAAATVLARLCARGALFLRELVADTGRLPIEVEEGLWDLVARGFVTADGFAGAAPARARHVVRRAALARRARRLRRGSARRAVRALVAGAAPSYNAEPRSTGTEALAEARAEQLLPRYGVVFRDLSRARDVRRPVARGARALRRLEARGTARGGRFVTGPVGEQYALPDAVDALRWTSAASIAPASASSSPPSIL